MMKITVFDEHHEAFLFWAKSISGGKMRKGGVLLHVDGHPDMAIPSVTTSVYSDDLVGLVEDQLEVGSFIHPALLRGFFSEVIFLGRGAKPQARKKMRIGSLGGSGLWLNPRLGRTKLLRKLYPDARTWHYTVVNDPGNVAATLAVLDIDLDYFYGYLYPLPHWGVKLTAAQLRRLRDSLTSRDEFGVALNFFRVDDGLVKFGALPGWKHVVLNNSRKWIACTIRYFVSTLRVRPELVSICRSVKSGFTPPEHAAYAEETLVRFLKGHGGPDGDPCDIESPLEIRPFIVRIGHAVYNPVSEDTIMLKGDSRFIWDRIERGRNFPQILEAMQNAYDIPRETLKRELLRFVLRLKHDFILA